MAPQPPAVATTDRHRGDGCTAKSNSSNSSISVKRNDGNAQVPTIVVQ